MAQSAKDYARKQLGNLDLSYLNTEEDVANKAYDITKSSLETNFNNLMNQIASNRGDTRKKFNIGRATIAENAYTANRQNQADLASRGVGSSGLKTLGEVGNRMETGQQYSNLANKFYSTMNDLDTTERQSRDQYNIDLQTAQNTLDDKLAGIGSRRAEAQNQYNRDLGQLAEQTQARWDANANARAALSQARSAAAQQLSEANKEALGYIITNKDLTADEKRAAIQTRFGVDADTATKVLQQLGIESMPFGVSTYIQSLNDPFKQQSKLPLSVPVSSVNNNNKKLTINDIYSLLGIK